MSTPLTNCNMVGAQVFPIADLGLTALLGVLSTGGAGVYQSTPFSTGEPATVFVIGQTASGNCGVKLSVAATAAAMQYASGTVNASFGTGATPLAPSINTTTASPYFGFQLTDAGSTSTFVWNGSIGVLTVLVVYGLTAGEGWNSIANGHKAVASRISGTYLNPTSDGSGVISLIVA